MDEMEKGSNTTLMVDLAMAALIAVTVLLAISPSTRGMAIGLGIAIPWAIGLIMLVVGTIDMLLKSSKSGDQDFSSFAPNEERLFVGHERAMRGNSSRANLVGFGLAGAAFALGLFVTMGLYTPCTSFCEHAPTSCNDSQKLSWKATCDSSCARLEGMSGLSLMKPTGEEHKLVTQPVSGTEYVQGLSACNFANGAGPACEEVVKRATEMGLWCPEKN
jgi:hypothetical protein